MSARFALPPEEEDDDDDSGGGGGGGYSRSCAFRDRASVSASPVSTADGPTPASNRTVVVAVAEEIKERSPVMTTANNGVVSHDQEMASSAPESTVPKRVSKFKQQRQNRS